MTSKTLSFASALSERELQEKIERCDQEAGWYFGKATTVAQAEYDATIRSLLGVTGPRWDVARDAARAKFRLDTTEARELCDRTFDCLFETGEVSSELDAEWTALFDRETVRTLMAAE